MESKGSLRYIDHTTHQALTELIKKYAFYKTHYNFAGLIFIQTFPYFNFNGWAKILVSSFSGLVTALWPLMALIICMMLKVDATGGIIGGSDELLTWGASADDDPDACEDDWKSNKLSCTMIPTQVWSSSNYSFISCIRTNYIITTQKMLSSGDCYQPYNEKFMNRKY